MSLPDEAISDEGLDYTALPLGWSISKISDAINIDGVIADGDWIESKDQDPNGGVRLIQLADIGDGYFRNKSERFMTTENAIRMNCTFLKLGDVLIARMPDPLGRACIFPGIDQEAVTVVDICLIRVNIESAIKNKLLMYWINTPQVRNYIAMQSTGTTRKRITRKKLEVLELPIPPLAEQQQIAAKLDELLAQVDNLKTRLDNIPKILKRFRQSVLAAAVIGKLTEDWRKDNHYSDSYPTLWPKKGLSEYGKLARGKSKHRPRNDSRLFGSQYPFIQTGEISNSGGRVSSATKFYSEFGFLQSKLFPSGTLCITIAANIADTAILDIDACFPDSVVGFSPDKNKCVVEFVKYLIDVNKGNLEEFAPATAQKNINLQVLNELLLPFPDLEEQTKIVARVEQLFTYADQIEQRVKDAQSRVNHLTQAILAKAFRGELTADWRVQNPELISGENSAEALLARIKAEREQTQAVKKAKATPATKSECSHYKGSES
ncbi:MAG: restriction endonuclease subunit S [Methylococcales bacterium]